MVVSDPISCTFDGDERGGGGASSDGDEAVSFAAVPAASGDSWMGCGVGAGSDAGDRTGVAASFVTGAGSMAKGADGGDRAVELVGARGAATAAPGAEAHAACGAVMAKTARRRGRIDRGV
jgi:hypothetical protein